MYTQNTSVENEHVFFFIAERYQCMCKEGTVFVNSAKRAPI